MSKESINKPNLEKNKVGGIFLPIVSTTNNQLENTLNIEGQDVKLGNGRILSRNFLNTLEQKAYDAVFKKYDLNDSEKNRFFGGLQRREIKNGEFGGIQYKPGPEHPSWRGYADPKWIHGVDYSYAYLGVTIYVNPQKIYDEHSLFAVLFHELDHYAYSIKKFSNIMTEAVKKQSSKEQIKNLIEELTLEDEKPHIRFSTELLARVDTADELLGQGVDNDIVDRFGIGNENETTGEQLYTDSIKYAKKFFDFQKGLYNLLGNTFGRDSSKPKNKQLSKEAEKEFEDIMTHLRNIVFNCSIESTKKVIDAICHNFKEATKREQFKSSIQRIYSDITR